jgi:hypothetical protein
VANLKAWNGLGKTAAPGTRLIVRPASAQTLLTTEDGDRRVVRSETNEPRIMHAVLRREPAEPERQAAPARTKRQHAAKPARRAGAATQKASAARAKPVAKKAPAAERGDAVRAGSGKRAPQRTNKRT